MFNIGDVINFIGHQHFTSSDTSAKAKLCTSGLAKIDMLVKDAVHPIHCIAEPYSTASVYGWINLNDMKQLTYIDALNKLAYYKIINSPDYWKDFISRNIVPHLEGLILKSAAVIDKKLYNADDAYQGIENLLTAEVIQSPDYWREMSARYSNIAALLKALGSSVMKKKVSTNNSSVKLRDKIITTAQSFLGYNEWDGSHRQIIDIYNRYGNLPRSYAVQYCDSWCATFVSVIAILCNIADTIIPRECSCEHQINLFKKLNSWVEDDTYMPLAGDIVYYTWDGNEYTENKNWADHVGIITQVVNENEILVIEGNKNDQVAYRTIWRNHPYIRGFGIPKY